MLSGGFLGVDECAVDDDLEDAAFGGDDQELGDGVLELFQNCGRQTDGLVEIASDRAVLDGDLHRYSCRDGVRETPRTMLIEMATSGTGVLDPAPPQTAWGGGGGGGWAWLLTASDAVEAEIVRGLLEATGVPVALDWRDPSPFAWMHLSGNLLRPVPVYVPASLIDDARLQLLELGLGDDDEEPEADAIALRRPTLRDRHRLLWSAIAALTIVAVAWIVFVEIFGFAPCFLHLFCI